jgi:hypothetical protein
MKNLLIITGAGASYDLADENRITLDPCYKPPITDNLFRAGKHLETNGCLKDALDKNPIAHNIGRMWREKEQLEKYLKDVKDGKYNKEMQAWFWSIPIYLWDLFTTIGEKYIKTNLAPTNYFYLLNTIISRSDYNQIIWINLNYDLFADYAIEGVCKKSMITFDNYMNMKTEEQEIIIKYTKPHGSVNWYRKNDNDMKWDDIRKGKNKSDFGKKLSGIYTKQDLVNHRLKAGKPNTYPAISAPLGEYDFIYSPHIEEIKPILKETDTILCIGFSARDKDILDLVKDNMPKIWKLKIVNGKQGGREAFELMRKHITNIRIDPAIAIYDDGFSTFLEFEELEKWLSM